MKPSPPPSLLIFVLGAIYMWNCIERKHFFSSKVSLGYSLLALSITTAVHYTLLFSGCVKKILRFKKKKKRQKIRTAFDGKEEVRRSKAVSLKLALLMKKYVWNYTFQ